MATVTATICEHAPVESALNVALWPNGNFAVTTYKTKILCKL